MTNNWYLPVDLQASGWRMWPSLGWRWIRAVGREDKDEILSLSSWALLYQTTCLELELGVHSVSTVNIAPSICWKKKKMQKHFPKGKGGFPSIFSFDMLYAQVFKLQQAMTVQPSQTSLSGVNILKLCYSWRVSSAQMKPGKEKGRNRIYPLSKLGV